MKIKPSQINIRDTLYQYSDRILEYKVVGFNELKTENHNEKFYILECQACTDHEKCKIAVKFNDYGLLEYSHMINNYCEEDENEHLKNSQYYWHKNENSNWFLTRKEARLFIHYKNIAFYEKEIIRFKGIIENHEKKITEQKDAISALTD